MERSEEHIGGAIAKPDIDSLAEEETSFSTIVDGGPNWGAMFRHCVLDQSDRRQISNRTLGCLGSQLPPHARESRAGQHLAQVIKAPGHAVQVARLPREFCGQKFVEHVLGRDH
jgi:hypothetical protein